MDRCCVRALESMQDMAAFGTALRVFLAASPFALILPQMSPPSSAKAAATKLAGQVTKMSGQKVLKTVTHVSSLPDFADSVRAADAITLNLMHRRAMLHGLQHAGGNIEGKLWAKLKEIYDEDGEIRSGGGWDLNPFW